MKSISLPIIESIENITESSIQRLAEVGFCYIKIDDTIQKHLVTLGEVGREYFALPEDVKQIRTLDNNYEGYINHNSKSPVLVERYAYKGSAPPEPLSRHQEIMNAAKNHFVNDIGLPLLEKIFEHENIVNNFADAIDKHTSTLSMIYYPSDNAKKKLALTPHQDAVLLTMLYIKEPGLEIFYDNQWRPVPVKSGYIVVNVGDALGAMTGEKYKSVFHRVGQLEGGDRLSMASFLGPNFNLPLVDYVNNKPFNKTFKEFLDEKLKAIYVDMLD